jgi:hypothetical protein
VHPHRRFHAPLACVLACMAIPFPGSLPQVSTLRAEAPALKAPPPSLEVSRLVAVDRRIARRLNALRPCVKQRLARVVRKLPRRVRLLVTSAHRTREEQASLKSTYGVKAKPGTSTHEDGRAIDVNVLVDGQRVSPRRNQEIIGDVMASEGFRHLGRRDPVHYSIPKEALDPSLTQGPELDVVTMDEMLEIQAASMEARLSLLER